jgi:hypothetical protein
MLAVLVAIHVDSAGLCLPLGRPLFVLETPSGGEFFNAEHCSALVARQESNSGNFGSHSSPEF